MSRYTNTQSYSVAEAEIDAPVNGNLDALRGSGSTRLLIVGSHHW
jgi:hypothetical protein